jgi:hypothetical protein
MANTYQNYLVFIQDKNKQEEAIDFLVQRELKVTQEQIYVTLLSTFFMEQGYEESKDLLEIFPLEEQAKILQLFVKSPYFFGWGFNNAITLMIYRLWPQYMDIFDWKSRPRTYPHDIIFESLYTMREILREFRNEKMSSEDYRCLRCKQSGYNSRYYAWNLFSCLPLLEEEGIELLMKIIKLRYDDAQDSLMFGLCLYAKQKWIRPEDFVFYLREIFLYWSKEENILISSSATAMAMQTDELIHTFGKVGVDLLADEVLLDVWKKYDVIKDVP